MEPAEIDLIRSSMTHLLQNCAAAELPARLLDEGWGDLLDDEPAIAVDVLGEQMGRLVAVAPLLDLVLRHAAGLGLDASSGFVLPPLRRTDGHWAGVRVGADVVVNGLVLAGGSRVTRLLVATSEGIVEVDPFALSIVSAAPSDPGLKLCTVTGRSPAGAVMAPAAAWTASLAGGHRAIAAELVGLAAQMLSDTTTYVLQRQQFGRQIGSFQTVKHRLADVHVAIAAARAAMTTAWADRSAISSMAAHVLAARAHTLAATHCHQVHGGIAFTTEHGFHRFIRRGQIVSGLLGHPDDLVHEIGRRLITEGRVPRTPQLT
jgi:Acyl-CoA dehydrogenase, C-terminal domain